MFILFHGPDEFSAREELVRLREAGGFEHNQDIFSGADADLATIRNICATVPFLREKRLIVLEGLPKPKRGARDDEGGAADAEEELEPPQSQPSGRAKKSRAAGMGTRAFVQA